MANNSPPETLVAAQKRILAHLPSPLAELLPLAECAGRVAAQSVKAHHPVPAFPQAGMDGFAIAARHLPPTADHRPPLVMVGEVAAGRTGRTTVKPGEAMRIMTGGLLPLGADRVIPRELCREAEGKLLLPPTLPGPEHIRAVGAELRRHQTIVRRGEVVSPEQLAYLAAVRQETLEVFTPPRVALFCTGSELLGLHQNPSAGQVVCRNSYLLPALVRQAGAIPLLFPPLPDHLETLVAALANYLREPPAPHGAPRLLVTTGGMGGGKYDLVRAAFARLGGKLHYDSLTIRPGRHTLFGTCGETAFFALPGPPAVVRILFNELVRPALFQAQGRRHPLPPAVKATLTTPIFWRGGELGLKSGILGVQGGTLTVHPCQRHEPATAIIIIPAHRRHLRPGESITVHPTNY